MVYSNILIENSKPLIFDTSIFINLHASLFGKRIVKNIPNDIFVSRSVKNELEHETSYRQGEREFLQNFLSVGNIVLVDMTEIEYSHYMEFVTGSSNRAPLGDGEAATIAIAANRSMSCVIDDEQGRQSATAIMGGQEPAWSLDLFLHTLVVAELGPVDAITALYLALRDGRMRVHRDHCDDIVDLIGPTRALECNSLPGYRYRRLEWQKKDLKRHQHRSTTRPQWRIPSSERSHEDSNLTQRAKRWREQPMTCVEINGSRPTTSLRECLGRRTETSIAQIWS